MITEDYVSSETAKLLKEKGFPQQRMEFAVATRDCSFIVNGNQKVKECAGTKFPYYPYSKLFLYEEDWAVLPTLQMVMKWLREMHNLFIEIQCYGCEADKKAHFEYSYVISEYVKINTGICTVFGLEKRKAKSRFPSYEEACEAAIKYCLEKLI